MQHDPSEEVQSFVFHTGEDESKDWCCIEFGYADGSSTIVAHRVDALPLLDHHLTESIGRCTANAEPSERRPWPLRALQRPRAAGPAGWIAARPVVAASMFESLDGQSILIRFDHADGSETLAAFSISAAHVFAGRVRDAIAYRQAS